MIRLADDNKLDDYEEGTFSVPVRRKWWQFWLPKSILAGSYTKQGNNWELRAFERMWFSWGKAVQNEKS